MRRPHLVLGLCCAALAAGCATGPGPGAEPDAIVARDLPLPPAVAAAVTAGALRLALPFADPLPSAHGVLVHQQAPDHWQLAFAHRGDAWRALASQRLALTRDERGALHVALAPLAAPTHGADGPLGGGFVLHVQAHGDGARLTGRLPAALLPLIDHALVLALDPGAPLPGLDEPNLAAWVEHRLLAAARIAALDGERERARELQQRAARVPGSDAGVHADLARDAERRGAGAEAADHRWQALLASGDPAARAELAGRLDEAHRRGVDPAAWRTAARDRLRQVDPECAADLLHTARRLRCEPALDYRLQSQLHRLRDDAPAARANALLAREHAGLASDLPAFVAELWRDVPEPSSALASPHLGRARANASAAAPPR